MTKKISRTAQMNIAYNTTVKDIQDFIEVIGAPPEARIEFHITAADRPWGIEQKRIEVSW